MRLVTCICVLAVGVSCIPDESTRRGGPAKSVRKTDVLTVFLTGSELGALKPCGCSGGQLGGFDRRLAVLDSVPRQRRLIVDTGGFVEGDSEQDLIKFDIIIQAFSRLDYDLVNLAEKDIEIAENLGLLNSIGSVFNVISSHRPADVNVPVKFTKQFLLKNKTVAVNHNAGQGSGQGHNPRRS